MKFKEAYDFVKCLNISEEGTLCFEAAVIMFMGGEHDWDLDEIYKETGFGYDDIALILKNFYANKFIKDGKLQIEVSKDGLTNIIEITLIALAGSGEIVRYEQTENKIDNHMAKSKTLNDHLFEQLERLSSADETTIKTEVEKAANIVMVSEQILNVARLKLEVMQAAGDLVEFSEIDSIKSLPSSNTEEKTTEETDEEEELAHYGGKLVSKKTLGNRKFTSTSIDK